MENIASYIDHTVLAANATASQIEKLCAEAEKYKFASVCVNSCYVPLAAKLLKDSSVNVCVTVGFPLGAMATEVKAAEASWSVKNGADEVDMVINVGAVKDKKYDYVLNDIKAVKDACEGKLLKVILETCLLTDEEKVKVCELSEEAGADYVKTSTGFSTFGATIHDVALMRKTVGDRLGVKAAGGIRSAEVAEAMIGAGASRIGCSAGVAIVEGTK